MHKFTKELVDDLANKLLIGLSNEENQRVLDEFTEIDKNMELITKIPNIENVEVMTHALDDFERDLSDDIVTESLTISEIMQNVKEVEDNQVVVPKVVN